MKEISIAALVLVGTFIVLVILAALGSFWGFITLPWFQFNQKVNMNRQVIQRTYNGDNAIYNYHWFLETYQAISALTNKIQNANDAVTSYEASQPKDKAQWSFEQQTEDARLRSVVLGLKNQKEDLVAEYNARSAEADRNIFQNGLPLYVHL